MQEKIAARQAALARRAKAHGAGIGSAALLASVLSNYRGKPLSGFLPIQTEIDPLPAMTEAAAQGPVGVPVIKGPGLPLEHVAEKWEPVFCSSNMRSQKVRGGRVNANERDTL